MKVLASEAAELELATVSPVVNLKLSTVLYPVLDVEVPGPVTSMPTKGVVLALRFKPNWLVPMTLVVEEFMAVMVLAPEVKVLPLTVMTYPPVPLVEADIREVPVVVAVVLKRPKSTLDPATLAQSVPVIDVPVQKTRDSGMTPVRSICSEVEPTTAPASSGDV